MDTPSSSNRTQGLSAAIIVAGALVAAAVFFSYQQGKGVSTTDAPVPTVNDQTSAAVTEKVEVAVAADDPVIGEANAPVTIIEFSDFECPFCRAFHTNTFPELKARYIDTGQVKFVYKDFPLSQIHPQAELAAEAGHCAQAQGKFWEYATLLFDPSSSLTDKDLRQYAQRVGVTTTTFAQCLTNHEKATQVAQNAQAALAAGITSTPAFVINGTLVEGALPMESFAPVIEAALSSPPPTP